MIFRYYRYFSTAGSEQRNRHTDRHTERHTQRQRDTQTDRERDTHRHTERHTDRQTDRETHTQTDRQRDTHTDTQTHRHGSRHPAIKFQIFKSIVHFKSAKFVRRSPCLSRLAAHQHFSQKFGIFPKNRSIFQKISKLYTDINII